MNTPFDTDNTIPTIRSAHDFKQIFLPKFRAAFVAALKEINLELKGPKDVETRHAIKGAFRAIAEIVADAGWGWSYASGDATSAVSNVFTYRSKAAAKPPTAYMSAGCAEGEDGEAAAEDLDEGEEADEDDDTDGDDEPCGDDDGGPV